MLSKNDFEKKQIIFVFFNDGEKLSFSNDNLVVKDADGQKKLQCTCYRLFLIFAVGNFTMTSVLLQKAKKFGFYIAIMSTGFKLYDVIGAYKDGNTLLKRKQYAYSDIALSKWLVNCKIHMQLNALRKIRKPGPEYSRAEDNLNKYAGALENCNDNNSILAYEGLAAKTYFGCIFDCIDWNGRQPRIKRDIANSTLDIGYTVLFSFVEALLSAYGFDLYCGIYHREFYLRKSLVCDMVEPFRPYIDYAVRKAFNLGQISADDFQLINERYVLKWNKTKKYVGFLMLPLIENRETIFEFVQGYYRCFMKGSAMTDFPKLYME